MSFEVMKVIQIIMKNIEKLMKNTFVIFWSTFRQHLLTNLMEMTSENDIFSEKEDFGTNVEDY